MSVRPSVRLCRVRMYVYIYIYMYVCTYVRMYVWAAFYLNSTPPKARKERDVCMYVRGGMRLQAQRMILADACCCWGISGGHTDGHD